MTSRVKRISIDRCAESVRGPYDLVVLEGVSHWIPTQAPDALARRDPGPSRLRRMSDRPPAPEPLPHPVVDNHCHLDMGRGDEPALPVEEALAAAAAVGVPRIVQIGCDLRGARWAVEAAATYDGLVAGVALHPNEAPRLPAPRRGAGRDRAARAGPRQGARGGRDRARHLPAPARRGGPSQEESFRRHIELAKRLDKTLVIHDRDAHDDVLRVIDDEGAPDRWVMHCFSGDAAFARACLDRGAHLSFAGTVTFKNAAAAARGLADRAARPGPGRDRRAVPHAHAAPRPHQRVLPRPADRAHPG